MSLVDLQSLNQSPYSLYNCSLTTIPEEITSDVDSKFKPLFTSCLFQLKKAFCSQSLASKVETTFWIDKCVIMQRIEKKGPFEAEHIRDQLRWMDEQFGVKKGALLWLMLEYSFKSNEKLKTLLKVKQSEDFQNLVKLKIALQEDQVEEATLARDKIQEREEKLGAAIEFFNYYASKCSLDQIKPQLELLKEKLQAVPLNRLVSNLPYFCIRVDKYEEVLGVFELKNQKGEPYINQEERSEIYKSLASSVLRDAKFAFQPSDNEKEQMFVKPMSFFRQIKDDEGRLIFAKEYIDVCGKHSQKDKAIEIAEMIENDPNRIEAFENIYRTFTRT